MCFCRGERGRFCICKVLKQTNWPRGTRCSSCVLPLLANKYSCHCTFSQVPAFSVSYFQGLEVLLAKEWRKYFQISNVLFKLVAATKERWHSFCRQFTVCTGTHTWDIKVQSDDKKEERKRKTDAERNTSQQWGYLRFPNLYRLQVLCSQSKSS